MIAKDAKEEGMRQALLDAMKLSETNRQIAEEYLDMDFPEEPELLEKVELQDFNMVYYLGGRVHYLEWLRMKKRKEEMGRYVRFIIEVGGSTAWKVLIGPSIGQAIGENLNKLLSLHTGEHAAEQKIAVQAGAYGGALNGNAGDVKMLCQSEKGDPEIFLRAMDYCHDCDGHGDTGKRSNAKLLLAAMYLHLMPVGAAPEIVDALIEGMITAIGDVMAFEPGELSDIQNFARTAEKDTPFPQRLLSIFSKRKGAENPTLLAGCAFLAIRHSLRFEIIFRIMVAVEYRYQGNDNILYVCEGITEDGWFQDRMDEIEDMLPIQNDVYIRWSLKAGCKAIVARMAVKHPEIIQAAATMALSENYEKLMEIVQNANPKLYQEMEVSYEETLRNKMISELLSRCYSGKVEAKKYLTGECPVETLEPYVEKWAYDVYPEKERYRKIEHLKEIGEIGVYRRALCLEALKKETGYFEAYRVYTGRVVPGQAAGQVSGNAYGQAENNTLLYQKDQLKGILQVLEEEGVPFQMQADVLAGLSENISDKKKKAILYELCVDVFVEKLQGQQEAKQWEPAVEEAVLKGSAALRVFCFRVLQKLGSGQYKNIFLSCAEDSTKQVRKLLLDICKEHREWKSEILAMLSSKKLKIREFAILVLEEWEDISCLEKIKSAMGQEKNKKLAGLLKELAEGLEMQRAEELEMQGVEGLEAQKAENPGAQGAEGLETQKTEGQESQRAEEQEVQKAENPGAQGTGDIEKDTYGQRSVKRAEERLAARIYSGTRKRKVEWVKSMLLPEVHRQDGQVVSQEYMLAILTAYADMETAGINQDAVRLTASLDAEEVSLYMQSLYGEWKQLGAEAKKRWVLYAAAIHGGTAMVSVLYRQIKEWAEHSRGAMAAEAVRALAFNGSSEALILVDQISRKYKFRQVKNAAGEALSEAASAMGIDREELEDRLVPDMGFDKQMERIFDYGSRKFTVRLNTALEMEVYDGNGKRLKNLPSPGKMDDPDKAGQSAEEFKQMKKQLKIVVQTQKLRLEQALSMARFWEIRNWRELFVKNPMMHQFATGLVWGVYENGNLKEAFRYMEDGSFNTVKEEEYFLPDCAEAVSSGQGRNGKKVIGLVHPLELSKEELAAWQAQLADYEVVQPFQQLNRPVYLAAKEDEERYELSRYNGNLVNGLSLSGKLLGMGWRRGDILDAGFYENYYHNDGHVGAELTFSGSSVGCENEEVTVYNIYFYKLPDIEPQALPPYLFSEENKCGLKDVNPRYFSEIVLQIAKAVGEDKTNG